MLGLVIAPVLFEAHLSAEEGGIQLQLEARGALQVSRGITAHPLARMRHDNGAR